MFKVRKSGERGVTNFGWLDSKHSFSFGDYYDPNHHHYRSLRVINDDRIGPGGGFPSHPHRDMEILTCVLYGEIAHKDSMGTGSTVRPGEWQRMTAGRGVVHSEFNPSDVNPTHLLQIWLMPDRKGLEPEYDQKSLPAGDGAWTTVASPDGRAGSLQIHQDALIFTAKVGKNQRLDYAVPSGRGVWLHVATGTVEVNGTKLDAGDAAIVEGEPRVVLAGHDKAEVILFDLA